MHYWHIPTDHPRLASHQVLHQGQKTANWALTPYPTPAATSSRAAGICGLTSRAPAARAGPRPSALGSASTRSGDAGRAGCPSLPCSKTPPQSSGLRDRAALPAVRTARRPAPVPTRPWRPRPHAGGGRQALSQDRGARRHCGENWGPRGWSGKVYFEGGGGDDGAPTTSDPPGGLLVPSSPGSEPSRPPRLGSSLRPPAALRRRSRPQGRGGAPSKWAGLKATAGGRSQNNVRWDWTRGSRCQVEAEGFASACWKGGASAQLVVERSRVWLKRSMRVMEPLVH